MPRREHEEIIHEIAVVGELAEREQDLCGKLLEVPVGGECILYFNSPGGSAYSALSMMTLLKIRDLQATGVVTGECSSAAIWIFAACRRRLVTSHSIFLFHRMRWESGEHIGLDEAREWARHFDELERSMDGKLAELFGVPDTELAQWLHPGRYVTGPELVKAGMAELLDLGRPLLPARSEPPGRRTKKS